MSHVHSHNSGDSRVLCAVLVNLGLTVAQLIGGVLAGSLALIADALHNFSDAISLIIAFGARKIARRPANSDMTFGYGRAEIVAALVNYTTLTMIGLYLIYESVMRFIEPQGVDGWLVVIIAAIALVVDWITALLTYRLSKESINIRAAFLHNVADALGSIAVIVAGTVIIVFGWTIIDPLITLLIAGYVLFMSFKEGRGVVRMLMLAAPSGFDRDAVIESLRELEGVVDVHHVHVWEIEERRISLEGHVVVSDDHWHNIAELKASIRQRLKEEYDIEHSTIEFERMDEVDSCSG
ncbi:MAG: cation diffusion facilitator family transporter [Pseudomonadales bacterium]